MTLKFFLLFFFANFHKMKFKLKSVTILKIVATKPQGDYVK